MRMSFNTNPWYFAGAAVAGLISAAGIFLIENYKQEKRRHVLSQDLARLDQQLSVMRRELEQLRALQKDKNLKTKKNPRKSRPASIVSNSTTAEDYSSAVDIDSSDMEFYDLSDDESIKTITPLDKVLNEIDRRLDEANNLKVFTAILDELEMLCIEYPENSELLWRLAKAQHKISEVVKDPEAKKEHIKKGISASKAAVDLNPDLADAHKWFAILIGARSDFQPMKERILDGHLFKEHVDIALRLNPNDAALHHMLGRFAYEIAGLKWYERKAAAAFYATPPSATYEDALAHFKEAEDLVGKEWKENRLFLAKCHIGLGDYESAVSWLENAERVKGRGAIDDKVDTEIKTLLAKYNSYR